MRTISLIALSIYVTLPRFAAQSVEWSGSFGTTLNDFAVAMDVDADNNIYTLGTYYYTSLFSESAAVDMHPGNPVEYIYTTGEADAVIAKYSPNGELIWAFNLVGSSTELFTDLVVDSNGNIYITGSVEGTLDVFPGVGSALLSPTYTSSAVILSYTTDGLYRWSKILHPDSFVGGNEASSLCLDSQENVICSGKYSGNCDLNPDGGVNNVSSLGSSDIFVLKLTSTGNYIHSFSIGGTGLDYFTTVEIDNSDNILLLGSFENTIDLDPGAGISNYTSIGSKDCFLAKYNSSGNYQWGFSIGTIEWDSMLDVEINSTNEIWIGGALKGLMDADPSVGVANLEHVGGDDICIMKYSAGGIYQNGFSLGSGDMDRCSQLKINSQGKLLVGGVFSGTIDFDTSSEVLELTSMGASDAFIAIWRRGYFRGFVRFRWRGL